ncbi:MAG: hypothetical protein M0R77_09360 [Gammaproteobacteria bacterium]|nr:hypothetical protein [Gammaproteobacteria bacterium]
MFVMDVPPEVPPQYAPVVVAQASQAQKGPEVERTIGVCHLATNDEELKHSAINNIGPRTAAWRYLTQQNKIKTTIWLPG